ncbi:hypothetical protein NDU88_002703 [Pleurodeles waltl]|uniref:Uncharacterized protein n=1 Tax=Pleurodeles waltl TaxID=8319 RepID=A0AAV7WRF5_PLEWA|nr:hypothetical protein NDU88_002703 [Pleurodeles waltl]
MVQHHDPEKKRRLGPAQPAGQRCGMARSWPQDDRGSFVQLTSGYITTSGKLHGEWGCSVSEERLGGQEKAAMEYEGGCGVEETMLDYGDESLEDEEAMWLPRGNDQERPAGEAAGSGTGINLGAR